MPKSKIILTIGFIIALLPILGFPHNWESFFEVVGGLSIVLLSFLISIDRRLSLKAKMHKRQARKRAMTVSEVSDDLNNVPPNDLKI
jgi:Kef-type K+ transport system membrane component KefB